MPGHRPGPADLVLVLTGGALDGRRRGRRRGRRTRGWPLSSTIAGAGAVLAGRAGSADATGAVGVARADPHGHGGLSTVDDVQSGSGQIAAVLALREQVDGRAGSYGTGVRGRRRRPR